MIYTVTFNPAIDYVLRLDKLEIGEINRSTSEQIVNGGKGINVSTVLKNLGVDNTALGFCAGFTGEAIESGIKADGVKTDFIHLKNGFSRINVKIRAQEDTDINGQGPEIEDEDIEKLYEKLDTLSQGDVLVLAGSIPNTLPKDIYEKILKRLEDKRVKSVVDATGKLLVNVLKYRPFLIKPNNDELGEIFGVKIETDEEIIEYAHKLREMGAENVLVSRGGKGAILVTADGCYKRGIAKGKVVNTVGAGDSMVAGFICGFLKTGDYEYALKMGTAAGGATTFTVGIATKEEIEAVLNGLE
ncbi:MULTISPECIES: 1-phosphofructokinase [unclassified Ruminococcus]|uniref:1-phosphofructokinase n=1 Tax=unclassified Ruminococcus TaxID=2608920 RepID=UPI00210A5D6B|nr:MULTISPECIES: 1-phosphofructokinase [unclassified Ruminococcus]MCQ4023388.1 1-phosphofructokinase [Ruminococcus sp. zg-924]MCQ4115756.1 1-phosphofructokinase [Ruminococcus sp. zg-921]